MNISVVVTNHVALSIVTLFERHKKVDTENTVQ